MLPQCRQLLLNFKTALTFHLFQAQCLLCTLRAVKVQDVPSARYEDVWEIGDAVPLIRNFGIRCT
jgi:hypothetical protein